MFDAFGPVYCSLISILVFSFVLALSHLCLCRSAHMACVTHVTALTTVVYEISVSNACVPYRMCKSIDKYCFLAFVCGRYETTHQKSFSCPSTINLAALNTGTSSDGHGGCYHTP